MNNPFFHQTLLEHDPANVKSTKCDYCGFDLDPGLDVFHQPVDGFDKVQGVYDTLMCVKSDIIREGGYSMNQKLEWFSKMVSTVYNLNPIDIHFVPKRAIQGYGGNIPHSALVQMSKDINPVKIRGHAFVHVPSLVEEPFCDTLAPNATHAPRASRGKKAIAAATSTTPKDEQESKRDLDKEILAALGQLSTVDPAPTVAPATTPVSVETKVSLPKAHPKDDPLLAMLLDIPNQFK